MFKNRHPAFPLLVSILTLLAAPCVNGKSLRAAARLELSARHRLSISVANSDRENDGLNGPVRRVKTETAKITVNKNGQIVEGARVVIETAAYDIKGNKTDNAYYLAAAGNPLTGREVYKHDARGNVIEMVVYNNDGSILSKEIYSYEYDALGNWTKMTTRVAVVENGKISFEPTEVTYRTITYYMEESVVKAMQTATSGATNVAAAKATSVVAPIVQLKLDSTPAPLAAPNMKANNVAAKSNTLVKIDDADAPARQTPSNSLKPLLRPVSLGVLNGRAKVLPPPIYPEIAKRARVGGTVTVEVLIDVSGKVISAQAISGPAMLRQAAEMAAREARFEPTMLSGQPVKVTGTINYNFALQ